MRRIGRTCLPALLALAGCQTTGEGDFTPLGAPRAALDSGDQFANFESNPLWIPLGSSNQPELNPVIYGKIFESTLHVLSDYGFDLDAANRYDGRIETKPRVSPGILQLPKPGSIDFYYRWQSTLQSYRHRVSIQILPADPVQGGFFVEVIARRELEDLPRPSQATVGGAIFRTEPTAERQFEVIDQNTADLMWIFKGRDLGLEQELLRRIKKKV